jgi:hypothetical protein
MKGVKLTVDFTSDTGFKTEFQRELPTWQGRSVNMDYTTSLCNCTWLSNVVNRVKQREVWTYWKTKEETTFHSNLSCVIFIITVLLLIWEVPVSNLGGTSIKFGRYQYRIWEVPVSNLGGTSIEFGMYQYRIWEVPVLNLAGTSIEFGRYQYQFGRYQYRIWEVPVSNLGGTSIKFGRYQYRIWQVPISNLGGTSIKFGRYQHRIWEVPISNLGGTNIEFRSREFGWYHYRISAWRPTILTEVSRSFPRCLQTHDGTVQYSTCHFPPSSQLSFNLSFYAI